MNFYYTDEAGAVAGPVAREQLQKLVDSGLVAADGQACFEGSEDWKPLSTFVRPTPKPTAAAPAAKPAQRAATTTTPKPAAERFSEGPFPALGELFDLCKQLLGNLNLRLCHAGDTPTQNKPQPKPIPRETQAKPSAPTTETRSRVASHLTFIRANSSYGALRSIIEVCFVLSLLGALGFMIAGWAADKGGGAWFPPTAIGILSIVLLIAARQSAFLLIDIADTLLHEHSKSRNA